jgi:hypothetical protein
MIVNFIVIRPIKATQNRVGYMPIILATQEAEQKGQGFSSAQVKLSKNPISKTSKPGVVIQCLNMFNLQHQHHHHHHNK